MFFLLNVLFVSRSPSANFCETCFRWIWWAASSALRARMRSKENSTVRDLLGWSSHRFEDPHTTWTVGRTDTKVAQQMMRLDTKVPPKNFKLLLKADVFLHPGVRFFHVLPHRKQVPTFSIASTSRFSSLDQGGKGASGPVLHGLKHWGRWWPVTAVVSWDLRSMCEQPLHCGACLLMWKLIDITLIFCHILPAAVGLPFKGEAGPSVGAMPRPKTRRPTGLGAQQPPA